MQKWTRRLRGALGMGLTWAIGWAAVGLLIGVASKLFPGLPLGGFFEVFDAPLPAMAIPGFFGGVIFSAVLGVAGRRRKFHELSLPKVAAWGAVGGVLLALVPASMVVVGLANASGSAQFGVWELTAIIGGPLALLGAASASGSLVLARLAQDTPSHDTPAQLRGADASFHDDPAARRRQPEKEPRRPIQ